MAEAEAPVGRPAPHRVPRRVVSGMRPTGRMHLGHYQGALKRVPTYKEQQEQLREKELNNFGFLGYPVLQTADVALYGADAVPVGQDQISHLELARELVRRFNHLYGSTSKPVLVEPHPYLTETPKILGLDGRKMSKSYGNAVELGEDPEQ